MYHSSFLPHLDHFVSISNNFVALDAGKPDFTQRAFEELSRHVYCLQSSRNEKNTCRLNITLFSRVRRSISWRSAVCYKHWRKSAANVSVPKFEKNSGQFPEDGFWTLSLLLQPDISSVSEYVFSTLRSSLAGMTTPSSACWGNF